MQYFYFSYSKSILSPQLASQFSLLVILYDSTSSYNLFFTRCSCVRARACIKNSSDSLWNFKLNINKRNIFLLRVLRLLLLRTFLLNNF